METALTTGALYTASWGGYLLAREVGSSSYGRFRVYDSSPTLNTWLLHPYAGSLYYLAFRSRGYSPRASFWLTGVQSLLLDFTIEALDEPASLPDSLGTMVFGSVLGMGLEWASFQLLSSDHWAPRSLGYFLNPFALFGFYSGGRWTPILDETQIGFLVEVSW